MRYPTEGTRRRPTTQNVVKAKVRRARNKETRLAADQAEAKKLGIPVFRLRLQRAQAGDRKRAELVAKPPKMEMHEVRPRPPRHSDIFRSPYDY